MKSIVHIDGPKGAGKTTLIRLFIKTLSANSLMVFDNAPDQGLTHKLLIERPKQTFIQLVRTLLEHPDMTDEALEWAFHDLFTTLGNDTDLITVGTLPESIPEKTSRRISHGLNRLIDPYDFILVDGFQNVLMHWLPEELTQTIIVLPPESTDLPFIQTHARRTPALILNRVTDSALSGSIQRAVRDQSVRLIGKIPLYASQEARVRQLPDIFKNCLLRLDLPLQGTL